MKIIFDNIVFSLQHVGGISTYWSELIFRLIRDNEDIFFIENKYDNIARDKLNINKSRILKENGILFFNRFSRLGLKDINENFIFHSSYNRSTSHPNAIKIVTVHDFIHEKYYKGARRFIHSKQKRRAIEEADLIIVISDNTRKDLMQYFPHISSDKIRVIYNGVSNDFRPLENQSFNKDDSPFFLFVGSRESYKNFNFIVSALEKLPDFELKIVGKPLTSKEQRLLEIKAKSRYTVETQIDDVRLNLLYNKAFCLVYPSSYEGFGIPILEAMKSGCPFIALNESSIPEVAGNAGVLLDELNIENFLIAVRNIRENRAEIIFEGLIQSQKFSWEKCYQQTIKVYKDFFNDKSINNYRCI